jgi:hypothetical protein
MENIYYHKKYHLSKLKIEGKKKNYFPLLSTLFLAESKHVHFFTKLINRSNRLQVSCRGQITK